MVDAFLGVHGDAASLPSLVSLSSPSSLSPASTQSASTVCYCQAVAASCSRPCHSWLSPTPEGCHCCPPCSPTASPPASHSIRPRPTIHTSRWGRNPPPLPNFVQRGRLLAPGPTLRGGYVSTPCTPSISRMPLPTQHFKAGPTHPPPTVQVFCKILMSVSASGHIGSLDWRLSPWGEYRPQWSSFT